MRNRAGYGVLYRKDGSTLAHRFSYEHFIGTIPDGLMVCHHCDNPPCVNPKHLFVGTMRDNIADCKAKGRTVMGRKNGRAKLIESQVIEIRKMAKNGISQKEIAAKFGIGIPNTSEIIRRLIWTHI